jgi:hypothetical protein
VLRLRRRGDKTRVVLAARAKLPNPKPPKPMQDKHGNALPQEENRRQVAVNDGRRSYLVTFVSRFVRTWGERYHWFYEGIEKAPEEE